MRTEVELKMMAAGLLGVSFPLAMADFVSAFKNKAKEIHPDVGGKVEEFQLLNSVYQEIVVQGNNAVFFTGGAAQVGSGEQAKPIDEILICWQCGSRGEVIERVLNHDTGQMEISARYKCDVCNGTGELHRNNMENIFTTHSKSHDPRSIAPGKPSGAGFVPDHIQ
jgi:DnaJ-class molecular chaperone